MRRMSRTTPEGVKRELRREALFGCCACGLPILQYHHIVEWSEENHFRVEDMMALCPNHHDQATKGAMPVSEQRELKRAPFNKKHGHAKGRLAVNQTYAAIEIGSIFIVNEGPFLVAQGEELFSARVEDGRLLLSLTLRSKNNNILCQIIDNDWISGDPVAWDIEADWQKLIVREKRGQINLRLDLKTEPAKLSGEFWSQRHMFKSGDLGLLMMGPQTRGTTLINLGLAGMCIEITKGGGVTIGDSAGGAIVSWPDRIELLWKTRLAWGEIKAKRRVQIESGQ